MFNKFNSNALKELLQSRLSSAFIRTMTFLATRWSPTGTKYQVSEKELQDSNSMTFDLAVI